MLMLTMGMLSGCEKPASAIHGYVEGDFVRMASTSSGRLAKLHVRKGDTVTKGQTLFELDATDLQAQTLAARANLAAAQASLQDLQTGQRPEELRVLQKQLALAQTNLANSRIEYERSEKLRASGTISAAAMDIADAAYKAAKAKYEEVQAQIRVAGLGARIDRIETAKANADAAQQNVLALENRLGESHPVAPAEAFVQDTYFVAGEFVAAGQPVVNLLPPGNVKVRFFIPEDEVSQIKTEQAVWISCDGCADKIAARVSYISSEAEYTPPVIYSEESRKKLVFMIEALPVAASPLLKPGMPVDILFMPPAGASQGS